MAKRGVECIGCSVYGATVRMVIFAEWVRVSQNKHTQSKWQSYPWMWACTNLCSRTWYCLRAREFRRDIGVGVCTSRWKNTIGSFMQGDWKPWMNRSRPLCSPLRHWVFCSRLYSTSSPQATYSHHVISVDMIHIESAPSMDWQRISFFKSRLAEYANSVLKYFLDNNQETSKIVKLGDLSVTINLDNTCKSIQTTMTMFTSYCDDCLDPTLITV